MRCSEQLGIERVTQVKPYKACREEKKQYTPSGILGWFRDSQTSPTRTSKVYRKNSSSLKQNQLQQREEGQERLVRKITAGVCDVLISTANPDLLAASAV